MNGSPRPQPQAIGKSAVGRISLILLISLAGFGFLGSLFWGCPVWLAATRAIAFAFAGVVGWLVYVRVMGRSLTWAFPALYLGFLGPMVNLRLLQPTRTPWPFPEMLANGVGFSVLNAVIMGLLIRWLIRAISPTPSTDAGLSHRIP